MTTDTLLASVSTWLDQLNNPNEALISEIVRMRNDPAAEEAICWYADLTRQAVEMFELDPNSQMSIIRAPGRVNLLGTHIDHRGG